MKYDIRTLLRYIKNKDIESFDKAVEKYHININLNFYDQVSELKYDESVVSYDDEFGSLFLDLNYPFDFLTVAIYYKDLYFCKYLVKKGAKLHKKNQLIHALFTDNIDIFQYIYSLYPKISLEEVLSAAAQTPAPKIYKYLVEVRHADITKTKYWEKAVDVWCVVGRIDTDTSILQYLLDSGFFPDHKRLQKLFILSKRAINPNAFDWLVKNCCKTAEDYKFALFVALSDNSTAEKILDLVKLCHKHNADLNKTPKGFEPVMFYIPELCYFYSEYVKKRISFSEIKEKTDACDTPLIINRLDAVEKIVKLVLLDGFDIYNTRDSLGRNFIEYLLRNVFDRPKKPEYFYILGLCRRYMNGFKHTPECIEKIPHDKKYEFNKALDQADEPSILL